MKGYLFLFVKIIFFSALSCNNGMWHLNQGHGQVNGGNLMES